MSTLKPIAAAVALLVAFGVFFLWRSENSKPAKLPTTSNRFEAWHAQREAKNPPGLTMILDTGDGKRTYAEGEYIPLVLKYSSSLFRKYNVETAAGSNAAGQSQRLHADGIWSLSQLGGFACCGNFPRILDETPYVFTVPMKLRLVPGRHELYITASQVYARGPEAQKVGETTSTILWLDIIPNPAWQQLELEKLKKKYAAQKPGECLELSALDIPEATAEKLKQMKRDACSVSLRFRPSEYERVEQPIKRWIHDPNHPVTRVEFDTLADIRTSRTYPGIVDWDDPDKDIGSLVTTIDTTVYPAVAHDVCTLPRKTVVARESTNYTVCTYVSFGFVKEELLKGTNCRCPANGRVLARSPLSDNVGCVKHVLDTRQPAL